MLEFNGALVKLELDENLLGPRTAQTLAAAVDALAAAGLRVTVRVKINRGIGPARGIAAPRPIRSFRSLLDARRGSVVEGAALKV